MRKRTKIAAAAVLSASLVLAGATGASALKRVGCTSYDFLWVQSDNTTCWANAGTQSVTLYNVYGLNSGNNAGYLDTASGNRIAFGKSSSATWTPNQTVKVVHIN